MSYLQKATEVCQLIGQGKGKDALEQYYADDVIVIEATGESFEGRDTQANRIDEWYNNVEAHHGGGVTSVAANEEQGITTIESWVEITFKGAPGPVKFEEVAVQNWKNGKIVRERFYYNAP